MKKARFEMVKICMPAAFVRGMGDLWAIWRNRRGEWRFRRVSAGNHKTVGGSTEGYLNLTDMLENAERQGFLPGASEVTVYAYPAGVVEGPATLTDQEREEARVQIEERHRVHVDAWLNQE